MPDARILAVSDVHGHVAELRWILRSETADAMFFLGDGLRDLYEAMEAEKAQGRPVRWPVYAVRGNCDAGWPDPPEGLAPVAGMLFFYTHGHAYGVKSGTGRLAEAAMARGADVALYGHTHRCKKEPGMAGLPAVFNPGSVMADGSYGVITVQDGRCAFAHRRVPPL